MEEIVNRVAKSGLITFDLEEKYNEINPKIMELDCSHFLFEGLVLREKDFRKKLKNHDWAQYQGAYVFVHCSSGALLPSWAYPLMVTYLFSVAQKVVIGSKEDLINETLRAFIATMSLEEYKNKRVIIKGCSQLCISMQVYADLTQRLQPVVTSLMYGEACSKVPLYKA